MPADPAVAAIMTSVANAAPAMPVSERKYLAQHLPAVELPHRHQVAEIEQRGIRTTVATPETAGDQGLRRHDRGHVRNATGNAEKPDPISAEKPISKCLS
jgi:hypothetical protein